MGIRKINVATPDPLSVISFAGLDQPRRLGIVNDKQIFGKLHALAVLLVVGQENVAGFLGQHIVAAVQRIVECLGDLEEIIAASDDVPLRPYFKLIQQRNEAVQHLSYAAAERR